jgi:hypothetical protein
MARNYPHVQSFVEQMWPHAVQVGDAYGIDPVTILTQAALETEWGKKVEGNNYFGVKSHGRPGGQTITTHEEVDGQRVKIRDSFRQYENMAESVEDYARFLRSNPRYQEALSKPGYREQLSGIAAAGYATDSKYPEKVAGVARLVTRAAPPTPPGSIPNMVGTALDVTPPRAVPATPSPDLQAMRAQPRFADVPMPVSRPQTAYDVIRTAQMGTPDMGSINALYATPPQPRAPITQNDLIFQSGIADTVSGTQALQAGQGDLASALERMIRPTLPTRSAQELAGIYADGGPTRPPVATPRLASPAQVAAAGAGSPWGVADGPAVRPKLAPTKSAPAMPLNVAQSYAGQERASTPAPKAAPRANPGQSGFAAQQGAPAPIRQALEHEIMQALGETVAVIPTTRPTPGQSGFAGQDTARAASLPKIGPTGGPALNSAPKPANQSIDIAMRREPGQTIATIPTTGSGVGKPPATKVVPSVPVNTAPKTAQTVPKGMPTSSRSRDAVAQQTAGTRTAAMWGSGAAKEVIASPAKPNPTGYGSGAVKSDNTRLAAGVYPKASSGGLDGIGAMPQFADLGAPPTTRLAVVAPSKVAPIPQARPTGVGTQLAVTPPALRNVARPRPRPTANPFGNFVNTAIQNIPMVRAVNHLNTMMLGNGYQRGAPGSGVMYQRSAPPMIGGAATIVDQLRAAGMSPAQAYDYANAGNSPASLLDRITGAGTSASSGSSASSLVG